MSLDDDLLLTGLISAVEIDIVDPADAVRIDLAGGSTKDVEIVLPGIGPTGPTGPAGPGVGVSTVITAGAGLTGGGDLSANRTINFATGDTSLTVSPDSVKVNTAVIASRAYVTSYVPAEVAKSQSETLVLAGEYTDAAKTESFAYTDTKTQQAIDTAELDAQEKANQAEEDALAQSVGYTNTKTQQAVDQAGMNAQAMADLAEAQAIATSGVYTDTTAQETIDAAGVTAQEKADLAEAQAIAASGVYTDSTAQETIDAAALTAQQAADLAEAQAIAAAGVHADTQDSATLAAAKSYTDSVVVTGSGTTITMSLNDPSGTPTDGDLWYKINGTGEIVAQWGGVGGAWAPMTLNGAVLTNLNAGSINTGTLDAARIAADSITTVHLAANAVEADNVKAGAVTAGKLAANAVVAGNVAANAISTRELVVGDLSNLAELTEEIAGTVAYGGWTSGIAAGWAYRVGTKDNYFMFRNNKGPVPLRTGDRIRVVFEAYASATTPVTTRLYLYGDITLSDPISGILNITTTPTVFSAEYTVTSPTALKTAYQIGLNGTALATNDVYLRKVRAYVMNAGELVVDGGIKANHIEAGAITAGKLAANSVVAGKIAANSIRAREMVLADTSNMCEINEAFNIGTIYDTNHMIGTWGLGWSFRESNAGDNFLFRDNQGPVPFKTGDRIRLTFEAYADTTVAGVSPMLYLYGDAAAYDYFPGITITTTPTVFAVELTVAATTALKTSYMVGIYGVAGKAVYVRNARAYVMNAGELIVDGSIKANHIAADSIDATKIQAGAVIAGKLAAGSVVAGNVAANTIRAREMVLADTSNMCEINESYAVGTIFDTTHAIVAGWSTRATNTTTYFMFRDKQGPVPFKTGDRVRVTFDAYIDAPITANILIWAYGAVNVTDTFGSVSLTTTPTAFALERTLTADYNDKQTFMVGISGGAALQGKNLFVRNARAYVMNAGELIVDGTIQAKHIAAQSISAEKLALGALSTNLVTDPSFEEPYPIVATNADHQWKTLDMVATGYVQRIDLPNSGLYALRLGAAVSGDAARVRSGVFPVTPGLSYVVSLALAKEKNVSVAGFYCRIAGGSTKSLTEYPAGPFQSFIAFGGEDPNAFENVDPGWISPDLYPYATTTDTNADGIHDGAVGYSSGTVTTGARSITTGQVFSAASMAISSRWGTSTEVPVIRNFQYRITVRYTGLAGTNARFRLYVDGVDTDVGVGGTNVGSAAPVSAASGTATFTTPAANYDVYRVYVWLEPTAGLTATSPTVTITSIEVEQVDAAGMPNPVLEQYGRYNSVFTVPAGITWCALRLSITGATAAQSIFVDDVAVMEVGRGGTEITAAGMRLFGADGTEVGAFVSNRPDYISVTDGRRTLASVSQAGAISGQTASFAGVDLTGDGVPDKGMEIFGTEFLDWLEQFPRGIMSWENFYPDNSSLTTETGYGEIGFTAIPGRLYRILIRTQIENNTANSIVMRLRMTYADDPASAPDPKVTSPVLLTTIVTQSSVDTIANADYNMNDFTMLYNESLVPRNVRILITMTGGASSTVVMRAPGSGNSTFASPEGGCLLVAEDVGPYRAQGGGYNTGGATAPAAPPLQTYTTTWTSTTATTYMGSGAKDSSQAESDMKQGYSSYDGDSKSLWIFSSGLVSTMAGVASDANITKVRIYLYANHWYNNAGGTALLKRHNYASAPSSSPSMTTLLSSTGWPKPGGRWVDITNVSGVKAALRGGTFRGIGVGPAGTTSQTYYGRFNKSGAKIEVTYKK